MATDPVPALLSLVKERLDPRAVSNWIGAYLGKRSDRDRKLALQNLQREFQARVTAEPRAAGLILRVVENFLNEK